MGTLVICNDPAVSIMSQRCFFLFLHLSGTGQKAEPDLGTTPFAEHSYTQLVLATALLPVITRGNHSLRSGFIEK